MLYLYYKKFCTFVVHIIWFLVVHDFRRLVIRQFLWTDKTHAEM